MSSPTLINEPAYPSGPRLQPEESARSAVSWPAVIAGALVASAVTIILAALGGALGLSSVSAWSAASNPSPGTFTAFAAIWLIVIQWLSSGLGGYVTGRMRTKWADIHTHEVFFRDTANGLLTWALATVLVVIVGSSAVTSAISGATHVAAAGASGAANAAMQTGTDRGTMLDTLLRPAQPNATASPQEARGEIGRILASSADSTLSPQDHDYLTALVAARTGISQPDAAKRVDAAVAQEQAAIAKAKQAAEAARKATSAFLFFTVVSMLIGAFIASAAAALGGRERDAV
jgi:hypothetical protein